MTRALSGPETTIGRASGNTTVFFDESVSRRHATVRLDGLRCVVEDVGSGRGTRGNGQRRPPPASAGG